MIGNRIKLVRQKNNLTQQAFAAILKTSSGYISEIESGKKIPGGDFYSSLKREFGVDLNWLITGEGENSIPENTIDKRIKKMNSIMEKLDDAEKDELIRDGEDKLLLSTIRNKKGLILFKETGIVTINLLIQLLIPLELILFMVAYQWIDGLTARKALSLLPILYSFMLAACAVYRVPVIKYLKHRYVSIIRFNSPYLGEW